MPPARVGALVAPGTLVVEPREVPGVGLGVVDRHEAVARVPCDATVTRHVLELEDDRVDVGEGAWLRPETVRARGDVADGALVVVKLDNLRPGNRASAGIAVGVIVDLRCSAVDCADSETLPVTDVWRGVSIRALEA